MERETMAILHEPLDVSPGRSESRYRDRTPKSRAAFDRNQRAVPGGVPAGLGVMLPYPLYIERAHGCHVWDADGHRLVDMLNGDWVFPLGHGNERIDAAITAQLKKGITFCQPEPDLQYALSQLIQERIPSIERMRFTTSGTEATMMALRVARAATGRPKIAKIMGGYHGTHDVSVIANGRYTDPTFVPRGLIPGTKESVVLLPFNDSDECERIIRAEAEDLAAVIVEPMLGGSGMIPATRDYLERLRSVTAECGVVLIFDEVVTCTLGLHGAQGLFGVIPDLTTLGKALGGGLPLGAFGGRSDLMDLVDSALHPFDRPVRHASTVGGIPICLAAGVAQLEQLTSEVHAHIENLGERLRSGVNALGRRLDVPLQATGVGQFFGLHWTSVPVVDIDTAFTSDSDIIGRLALGLCNEGYLLFYFNLMGVVSLPMTTEDVDGFIAALEATLKENDLC
jgi:glutamate-1-semialdehyde 2,1-aminomutase